MDVKLTMMTMIMIVQDKLTKSLFLAKVRNNTEELLPDAILNSLFPSPIAENGK